jgi:hypothetical protein
MTDNDKLPEHPEPDRPLVDYSKRNNAPGAIENAVKDFKDSSGLFYRREIDKEK